MRVLCCHFGREDGEVVSAPLVVDESMAPVKTQIWQAWCKCCTGDVVFFLSQRQKILFFCVQFLVQIFSGD